ncbi:MAG: methionine--tRNA ligase [Bacteroidota bacterium]|nr:methionine--tRNA ligase [Bacteroidota bacterium]MDP4233386.1 methionine--tRNA ligase [Bacteroidota bacterium]MDP4242252.1 methionine--tRNA ligase [Bacteroidota bacterium]MDP4287008.1 methionine--tRNA ligase [Bacteroidota bacterium]
MPNFKRTLITAALPYVNAPSHVGHLAGCYLPADLYARFKRLKGEDILFICGSDELGAAITISAEKEGVSPQIIIDRNHTLNKASFEKLGISFDYYGRTSSATHRETAQQFFLEVHKGGYLVPREEPQLYDEAAKMFLPDRYVEGTCPVCSSTKARGDQCENCGTYLNQTELIDPISTVTGTRPVLRATKHWYFALSRFQNQLEDYVESHRLDWKDNVLQGARSWLKSGLQDRPITRDLTWGIPVPLDGAEGKVLYVWFDAPIGYISATKEARSTDWQTWWQDYDTRWVAFLGKDNIVFHTILFPAMLMAHNASGADRKFILPDNVPANEFMNLESQKLSKSRGWIIEIHEMLERYPVDVIRYAIATMLPEQKDSDFTWREFQAHVNNELADIFGNFANRVLTFASKHFENKIMGNRKELDDAGNAMLALFGTRAKEIAALYERFRLREVTSETMDLARTANKYFNDAQPWKLIKENKEEAAKVIRSCLEALRALAIYFAPITPDASKRILATLGSTDPETWDNAHEPKLHGQVAIGPIEILFHKIEDETVANEVERLRTMAAKVDAAGAGVGAHHANSALSTSGATTAAPEHSALISIDDFKKIQLRTALILEAERVPKSKKLVKLQISLGEEKRQIVAGIGEKYTPEQLVGKTIVVVANLKPAKLMGQESNGMLLAVNDANGVVSLVTPEWAAMDGLEVR